MIKKKGEEGLSGRDLYQSLKKMGTGDGVFASVGTSDPHTGNIIKTHYVYSTRHPKITTEAKNALRNLEVTFSSTESYNNELLHFLFGKTRSS